MSRAAVRDAELQSIHNIPDSLDTGLALGSPLCTVGRTNLPDKVFAIFLHAVRSVGPVDTLEWTSLDSLFQRGLSNVNRL